MNQLIHETSPYLLQHAHNPVHWHPWGEAALEKAKQEDKPILVSIGYAACHWCHVMERESFEDEATAELMNRYFVNIKIDREERPDLDHIYMDAVQAMTGSGGWPLNVFLTPEGKPFYGGTYFPPERAHNRPSWKEVLESIYRSYTEKKTEVASQAENLTEHLLKANSFGIQTDATGRDTLFTPKTLQEIANALLKNADTEWGGFGRAPKFPQTLSIQYLLRHYHFSKDETSLEQALLSLDKMIAGGIYDQLGGGFSRYSTDAEWLAPHFEKMLYDNALLVSVLAEACQLLNDYKGQLTADLYRQRVETYRATIIHTLAFIEREMTDVQKGFYSALDADSEGVEGKFYTWQKEGIDPILQESAPLFCEFYNVQEQGNWEHTNILWVTENAADFAARKGIAEHDLQVVLEKSRQLLMAERAKRVRPQLDDKILLGWNALMNTAFCKAYAALGIGTYKDAAIANMAFLEEQLRGADGSWNHTYKNGIARIPAFLDDYAYLIAAYIHLQEITGEEDYLLRARDLTMYVIDNFTEEETGFFYYTHRNQSDVIIRKKEIYDGATPSGNAVMAGNLYYLAKIFDTPAWQKRTHSLMLALRKAIVQYPGSFAAWAGLLQQETIGTLEIAIVGQRAKEYLAPVLKRYLPNKILQAGETKASDFPLLSGKEAAETGVTFFVCKDYSCSNPSTDLAAFLANV